MSRPMINETLFNTENYDELRRKMVEELSDDEMGQPTQALLAMLEDFVWRMFQDMDDDTLQDHYDQLMEYKKDE